MTGGGIDGPVQAVRQRHIKHVVGYLPGGVSGAAGIVEEGDVETTQTGFLGSSKPGYGPVFGYNLES